MKRSNLFIAASIFALGSNTAVWAQAQDQTDSSGSTETVIVSGSLISRPGFSAPTPVSVVNTADLLKQAPTEISDALNEMPQFGLPSSPTAGWQGASTNEASDSVNLRNLGATRTLVLLDGQRVVPFSTVNTVDLSTLPSALVKRVDVVTGGASAAYGSDAVAGVVNLILDHDFVGLKGDLQYGNTSDFMYETYKGDLTYGTTLDGDKIHLIGSVSYTDSPQSLYADTRDWYKKNGSSAIVNNPAYAPGNGQPQMIHTGDVGLCKATQGGLITSGPLKNTQFVGSGAPEVFNPGTVDQDGILCYGGQADTFAQDNALVGETALVYNAYGYGSYQIASNLKAHVEVDYGHSGGYSTNYPDVHNGNITLSSTNAFLPASVESALLADGQTSFSFGTTNRNLGLPQFDSNQYGAFRNQERVAAGLDGSIGDNWTWTAHYGHGEVHLIALFPNNPYEPKDALNKL
jgi:iron complex outermembrane recepter protein